MLTAAGPPPDVKTIRQKHSGLQATEHQRAVRNLLAIVKSIAAKSARSAGSLDEFASHFDGRLACLVRTQNMKFRSGTRVDFEELLRGELLAEAASASERVNISGSSVELSGKVPESIALTVHELITNAVKYGALANPPGQVEIRWWFVQPKTLLFEWRERNVSLIDIKPAKTGFGRELIERGLPYEIGAKTSLEFAQGGVRCVLEFDCTSSS